MDKQNASKEIEEKWYKFWEEKGYFKADPASSKKPYSLLMPPPNLTGELHLGHAMQHSIMDAIARFKRLQNFDVLLLPGVDHAGIQFEGTLNKVLEKEGLSKRKLGREKWLERAWQFKDEIYKSFHKTWTVFGLSADWSREVFTLEPKVQEAVFHEFKTFWDQDLLYKGAYIVQWCPKCGTAIEDVEMEYVEKKDKLYYLQYGPLVIATTRPETKFADTAVAVNPKDKRYEDYVGKEFEVETLDGKRKMKIIADEAIDPNFGTGAEKVTPGHDFLDYEIGKRHNLPILHVIDKEGRLTELAGKYAGMKVHEAREKMIPELKEKGILLKIEDYVHSVPVCERCKTVVEPIISEEWFVKMKPLAQKGLKNIKKVEFYPENYLKIISEWMENIHDWSISRSLWWGHRIPVWYCKICNPQRLVGKDKDMVVSLEQPDFSCQTCSEKKWVQDEQVLDTWFSSGIWPLATLGWPSLQRHSGEESDDDDSRIRSWTSQDDGQARMTGGNFEDDLEKYFPWDFEISAPEIKYLWIARMIMLSLHFVDDIPFKNMFFHGMLRDLQGRKFSKSLGNGIDPYDLVAQWGVDSVRMALYTYSIPGRDGKTSRQLMDERCKNFRNFGTKLRNIHRFIFELKPDTKNVILNDSEEPRDSSVASLPQNDNRDKDDEEIVDKLNKTIQSVTKNLDSYSLHLAIDDLYNFIWHDFADEYIEKSKKRRVSAQPVLEYVLKTCLILLHPFMPFATEELYQKLPDKKESIMVEKWPHA